MNGAKYITRRCQQQPPKNATKHRQIVRRSRPLLFSDPQSRPGISQTCCTVPFRYACRNGRGY